VTSSVECEQYSLEPKAPFTQVDNPLKWKACVDELIDDYKESIVSEWSMDIEGPDLEDGIEISDNTPEPEPVVVKKEKVQHTTSLVRTLNLLAFILTLVQTSVSVATSVTDSQLPAQKRSKSSHLLLTCTKLVWCMAD
jgi:hypothetical protein